MPITEVRSFPVSATVVLRSTLFALANVGATLQTYNEDSGVVVATVSSWLGMRKQEVVVRVRGFDETSLLEVDAPDVEKAQEILRLISGYVRDGARVQANATMQWVDLARQQAAAAKRQEVLTKAKSLMGSPTVAASTAVTETPPASSALVEVAEDDPAQLVDVAAARTAIPDNPGVLVKNRQNMLVELKVDPQVFRDRSAYLVSCSVCQATALRGSAYCPNCGRPLTIEAVQPELRQGAEGSANRALMFGLAGLAFNIVPFLILILPALLGDQTEPLLDSVQAALTPINLALVGLLGLLPAVVFGIAALRQGQRASWYLNLSAALSSNGRGQATAGNALGWLAIYLVIGWLLLMLISLV
jgi:hypothetical protein